MPRNDRDSGDDHVGRRIGERVDRAHREEAPGPERFAESRAQERREAAGVGGEVAMSPDPKSLDGHAVVSRNEWLAARKQLLAREKAHTHESDALARERQRLPWVRVDKRYVFDTPQGKKSLADLFDGRSEEHT